ncbi:hypothetical protein, partial [Endozoicomonas sp. SESOKO1]|uniref:hypothetical protein n=1 Tax=Endozoicomonas sp. SESOKO1 TaxID=2828742 RepID=UPI0021475D8D
VMFNNQTAGGFYSVAEGECMYWSGELFVNLNVQLHGSFILKRLTLTGCLSTNKSLAWPGVGNDDRKGR